MQADNDAELAAKVFTLILAVMNAADADSHAALQLRFIRMLLEKGEFQLADLLFHAPMRLTLTAPVCQIIANAQRELQFVLQLFCT